MAQIIGLPKLSPTMEEGVLVRWTKKEGDKVSPGDLVAEVETDKANMDFNIEDDGVLLKLLVKEGDTVKLGAPVAILGKAGEDVSALVEQAKSGGGGAAQEAPKESKEAPKQDKAAAPKQEAKQAAPKQDGKQSAQQPPQQAKPARGPETSASAPAAKKTTAAQAAPAKKSSTPTPTQSGGGGGKLLASPLAKSLAIELGIDLRTIQGSGPGGRIVERDVRSAASGGGNGHAQSTGHDGEGEGEGEAPEQLEAEDSEETKTTQALTVRHARQLTPDAEGDYTDVPASNMRKRIAARLTEAKRDVPHFYLMRTFDAAPMLAFRGRLNELLGDKGKVSVNDLIIKAAALALRRVPDCNAMWEGDAIRHFHRVHIGVAVALDEGLVTPVVRDADQKGIGSIAAEVRDLADRAKNKRLKGHEITGSTFSISNLGMMGIRQFASILNPPEGMILSVGAGEKRAVVKDDKVVIATMMTVTLTCDHRVVDGATGAKWLQHFKQFVETPEAMLL